MHLNDPNLVRVLLGANLAIFTSNLVLALYILIRMIIPKRTTYFLLWAFYLVAIIVSILQIILAI